MPQECIRGVGLSPSHCINNERRSPPPPYNTIIETSQGEHNPGEEMRERNLGSNPYFQSCDDVDDGDDDDHDDDGEDTDPIPTRAPTGYTLVSASRKPRRYHPQRVSSRRTDGPHPPVAQYLSVVLVSTS